MDLRENSALKTFPPLLPPAPPPPPCLIRRALPGRPASHPARVSPTHAPSSARPRCSDAMSEGLRGALNALLFRTGDQSKDFMVVLATNRPGDLDDAVLDRMDEALEFGLPGQQQRRQMLDLYLEKYITAAGTAAGEETGAGAARGPADRLHALLRGRRAGGAERIEVQGITPDMLDAAAKRMDGFSGREIAKFMASVQVRARAAPLSSAAERRGVAECCAPTTAATWRGVAWRGASSWDPPRSLPHSPAVHHRETHARCACTSRTHVRRPPSTDPRDQR